MLVIANATVVGIGGAAFVIDVIVDDGDKLEIVSACVLQQ